MSTKIAMHPREPTLAFQQICPQIFADSSLKSDQNEFTYSTTDDYGKKIEKLLFCKPKEGFSSHYFENIKDIGAIEGFEVVASETVHCCRDPRLRANEMILEPTWNDNIYRAIGRSKKRAEYLKNHCSVLTEHPSFNGIHLGSVALHKLHRFTREGADVKLLRESRLYFEGGNCFHLTNKNGVSQFVVGEDLYNVTHQGLRMKKWFNKPEQGSENYKEEAYVFQKFKDKITPDYLSGKTFKKVTGLIKNYSQQLSNDEVEATLKEMNHMELLTVLKFTTEREKKKGREIASEYLAEMEFVKKELFPAELRCQPDQVIFSPQFAYHIDMAMAPGPKGSILLQDYTKSLMVLQSIMNKYKQLGLSDEDVDHLTSFIETTEKVGKDLKPLFDEAKKRFEQRGRHVIPTPGAFYSYRNGKPFNINFLNCITGYSEKTGHFYVIAPGTQTDGSIADRCMDRYVEFLRSQGNNIAVYFVGRDPNNERDFTEAVSTTNSDGQQLGPHCLSFELKISPHRTKIT